MSLECGVMSSPMRQRVTKKPWRITGMAQAFLLDRLMPQWKRRILRDTVLLEDLLGDAVKE